MDAVPWLPLVIAVIIERYLLDPSPLVFRFGGSGSVERLSSAVCLDTSTFPASCDAKWVTLPDMPTAREKCSAAAFADGRIFVTGGIDNHGTTVATVECYDPATRTWSAATPMSSARSYHVAFVCGGVLHVISDRAGDMARATGEVYDEGKKSWHPMPSIGPAKYYAASAVFTHDDDNVYLIGGINDHGSSVTVCFNVRTQTWIRLADMPTQRTGFACVAIPHMGIRSSDMVAVMDG